LVVLQSTLTFGVLRRTPLPPPGSATWPIIMVTFGVTTMATNCP
jgi:hypothetical protein